MSIFWFDGRRFGLPFSKGDCEKRTDQILLKIGMELDWTSKISFSKFSGKILDLYLVKNGILHPQ